MKVFGNSIFLYNSDLNSSKILSLIILALCKKIFSKAESTSIFSLWFKLLIKFWINPKKLSPSKKALSILMLLIISIMLVVCWYFLIWNKDFILLVGYKGLFSILFFISASFNELLINIISGKLKFFFLFIDIKSFISILLIYFWIISSFKYPWVLYIKWVDNKILNKPKLLILFSFIPSQSIINNLTLSFILIGIPQSHIPIVLLLEEKPFSLEIKLFAKIVFPDWGIPLIDKINNFWSFKEHKKLIASSDISNEFLLFIINSMGICLYLYSSFFIWDI